MADKPIAAPLPADLPENWQAGQIVAPTGEEAGLTHQHGYNYLMEMVNKAQQGVNAVNDAFASVSGKRTCRFVVGTSTAGWTQADCDFLCDGTNDEVELQAAIDALLDGRGEVVILGGTYNLAQSISVLNAGKDVSIVGDSVQTLLTGTSRIFDFNPLGNIISIQGVRFEGTSPERKALVFMDGNNVWIENCCFKNCDVSLGDSFSTEKSITLNSVVRGNSFESCSVNGMFLENPVIFSGNRFFGEDGDFSVVIYGVITGNYFENTAVHLRDEIVFCGNQFKNGSIVAECVCINDSGSQPNYKDNFFPMAISGNTIFNGSIESFGGGISITGNAIYAPSSAEAVISIHKKAANSQKDFMPAIVANFIAGGQVGILLKEYKDPLGINNDSTSVMINSNRIYNVPTPIKIEANWSSCMVTDNVFETGAITDLGTNNIIRFNSDDSSTGGSSGGGTTAGVTKFNGRSGAVLPQSGDYTAAMVGAIPASQVQAVQALTQTEYDALGTKSASTLYLIKE